MQPGPDCVWQLPTALLSSYSHLPGQAPESPPGVTAVRREEAITEFTGFHSRGRNGMKGAGEGEKSVSWWVIEQLFSLLLKQRQLNQWIRSPSFQPDRVSPAGRRALKNELIPAQPWVRPKRDDGRPSGVQQHTARAAGCRATTAVAQRSLPNRKEVNAGTALKAYLS